MNGELFRVAFEGSLTGDFNPAEAKKRLVGERRNRFRRGPRAGAIVGDGRLEIRRTKDRKYFLDLNKHNHQKPLAFQSYKYGGAEEQVFIFYCTVASLHSSTM
jgi:hypothetical protein